jgi:hypothetical protein
MQLATRPDTSNTYNLCLYPLSLERSALLGQLMVEERHSLETVEATYQAEQALVEKEYKQGRARIRDRLMEGIEERRKRAREERDSDNTMGGMFNSRREVIYIFLLPIDSTMDSSSRGHPTRKLRNKFGGSPPPNILPYPPAANPAAISSLPTVIPPVTNPLSLAVDELPSPFPLPLTSTTNAGPTYVNGPNGKRKAKGGARDVPVLGKALEKMTSAREAEIDEDLRNIQDNHKGRRRPAVAYAARTKIR